MSQSGRGDENLYRNSVLELCYFCPFVCWEALWLFTKKVREKEQNNQIFIMLFLWIKFCTICCCHCCLLICLLFGISFHFHRECCFPTPKTQIVARGAFPKFCFFTLLVPLPLFLYSRSPSNSNVSLCVEFYNSFISCLDIARFLDEVLNVIKVWTIPNSQRTDDS